MRVNVSGYDGLAARPLGEAEDRSGFGVEPIRVIANAVLLLDREVFHMIGRDIFGRGAGRIMPIDEQRHGSSVAPPCGALPVSSCQPGILRGRATSAKEHLRYRRPDPS